MKNNQKNTEYLSLPEEICKDCGFEKDDTLKLHGGQGALVITKNKMTVLELAGVINTLSNIASDLTTHLALKAGICDYCGDDESECCEGCSGDDVCAFLNGCNDSPAERVAHCPLCIELLDGSNSIHIPEYILEDAGIPKGTKLEAFSDDEGEIVVTVADIQEDITDMPPALIAILASAGVCLAEIDELIMLEEIVYGDE